MLRVLIIDDDPLICDLIQHFCQKSERVAYTVSVGNCKEGLQLLSIELFDVIYLDFNLPDMNGQQFLELDSSTTKVVMLTSNADFAVDSYNYPKIIDYLTKPVTFNRFMASLDKLSQVSHESEPKAKDSVFVKEGHSLVRINLNEISYIKSDGNYLRIYHGENMTMTLGSLTSFCQNLPASFIKVHRSYVVNLEKVKSIQGESLIVDTHMIPVSASQKDSIIKKITTL